MIYMPLIRPILTYTSTAEFTHGYWPGALIFYVSICNKYEEEWFVKDEDTSN